MADSSGTLRAAREQAGLTLEEISARTRIKVTFLQAIEAGELEKLPGPFFIRAFLRTYARELHLSPDEIVGAYDSGVHPVEPAGASVAIHGQAGAGPTDRESSQRALRAVSPSSPWRGWAVAPAAVILLATVIVLARVGQGDSTEPIAVGTTGETPAPAAVPAPVPPAREPERISVEIRASEMTWIAATADGKRVVYRLFQPGDRVTVQAREELSFRIGNAGAFDYSINGTPGSPVGGPGDVREFTITRENYRSLLKTPASQ